MSTQESTPELDLPPGAATRDYARDSLVPFEPLVTHSPVDELTPEYRPAKRAIGPWALGAIALFAIAVVIGLGSVLLS